MTGSKKWPTSYWSEMLAAILPILQDHRTGIDWWSFGGGTALAVQIDHRISYDIDIFLDSSKDLRALTPNANPQVKALLNGLLYEYHGNYLKLSQPGGEIDIIVAPPQTDTPYKNWNFRGNEIQVETAIEIMAKKIFYRPSTFKIRDLFDLAAVIDEGYGEELLQAIAVFNDKLVLVRNRIAVLKSIYAERAPMDVNPTEKGLKWLDVDNVIPLVHDFLAGCSLNSVQESKLDLTP